MDFVVGQRPDQKDRNIVLSIAGAFTDLNTDKVDGIYMSNGTSGNTAKKNSTLGGAIKIVNGDCEIFPSKKGKLLNDSIIKVLSPKKASFFQQIQMIENGTAAKFKDVKLFQRRGIAKFKNGKTAIIESDEAITLKVFADDLVELGVNSLLYTDMGAWDEGWYRDPVKGNIVVMGKDKSQTARQSNWVVFSSN